ncbi:hypothetical protein CO172_00325 [Candidatus Uhrbacteria bacterium CG_4_9_14_3_um_filter_36_7]|uniref:Uncharacterized protein n=1 Tax=Candidatus Uhrbacteria bacterium CG_4_9_14_3_um_filter_36_7 TaxID=1975033 RepID=A0A2M7XIC9_9BACT|nr:MAG: hypothetical protein CO172_00325 [Candidatus Uhrbacteria bacterium CG_4_9_14_3_um_filter_36_7]
MNRKILQSLDTKTERTFERSLWFIEHRSFLRSLIFGIWFVVDLMLISFAGWVFIETFLLRSDLVEFETSSMAVLGQKELHQFSKSHTALNLEINPVSVFSLGDNQYDFYTQITNPNSEWWATFDYVFIFQNGETTPTQRGFILPGSEKPLVFLGYKTSTKPVQAKIYISQIDWKRLDAHVFSDYETWLSDRIAFEISDTRFSRELEINGKTVGQIEFSLKNKTAFGYWEPRFFIFLIRGNTVAGVTSTTLSSLKALEERTVSVHWLGTLPAVSRIEVIPDILLFDPSAFMPI